MPAAEPSQPAAEPVTRPAAARSEPPFLAACHRRATDWTPVWFMRQAGRSLPEYRALREGVSMLDSCARPEMVVEITMQPVRRHGVDAAILYSDIVVPLKAIGVDLDIVPGTGPVIAHPVRSAGDLDQLRPLTVDDVPYVADACAGLVAELGRTPLIGFAGAPFTLASYLVEGGPSRDHARTKALMHDDHDLWHDLLGRLATITGAFLRVQVESGARAVQLFDSWVGTLSAADYVEFVQPHSAAVLSAVADLEVPRIHFGVDTGELLSLMGATGADVVGVDWRVSLLEATRRVGPDRALQGNLDPALLRARWPVVEAAVRRIVSDGRAAPGHVFNLGHGVPPDTDPDVLTRIVELVHSLTSPPAG